MTTNWAEHFNCTDCTADVPCLKHVVRAADLDLAEPTEGEALRWWLNSLAEGCQCIPK